MSETQRKIDRELRSYRKDLLVHLRKACRQREYEPRVHELEDWIRDLGELALHQPPSYWERVFFRED